MQKYSSFADAFSAVMYDVENVTFDYIKSVEKQVMNDIKRKNRQFFRIMVRYIISDRAPAWSEFSPGWVDLSEKYIRRKGHARFYDNTGQLKTAILGLTPVATFGTPTISYMKGGSRLNPNVRRDKGTSRLRDRRTGRFVPRSMEFKSIPNLIRIQPFPEATNSEELEALLFPRGSKEWHKLRNYKGGMWRRFLDNYMQWWIKYQILPTIDRTLKRV